jgi:phosphoserine phosphatase
MSQTAPQWRIACFDLDGTLVHGTSTCQHLRERLGFGNVTRDFDERYAAGLMTTRDIADIEASYYAGLCGAEIESMLRDLPLIDGIVETLDFLRRRNILLLLTTITWTFAAKVIAGRFGFDAYSGYVMESLPDGTLSGRVELHFDETAKRDFVIRYCADRGIDTRNVFAVGDSRSDIPLFTAVGYAIAVNATEQAVAAAACAIQTRNLTDVLKVIPGLMEPETPNGYRHRALKQRLLRP